MESPEYLYYAAMFLVALPVAGLARSWVALLVFGVWALGQALYLIGLPEPQTQTVIYGAAAGLCALGWRRGIRIGLFAAVLFAPLCGTSFAESAGWLDSSQAWWSIYWIALTQAVSLPFITDLPGAIRHRQARNKKGGGMGMLRVVHG